MNENDRQRIKAMFPRGSAAFFELNTGLCTEKLESTSRSSLVGAASGKEKGDARVSVGFILYRVRLLDPDNAVGATKTITDCLCQINLIPGDAADQIRLEVTQEKVAHMNEQRTELRIKYP